MSKKKISALSLKGSLGSRRPTLSPWPAPLPLPAPSFLRRAVCTEDSEVKGMQRLPGGTGKGSPTGSIRELGVRNKRGPQLASHRGCGKQAADVQLEKASGEGLKSVPEDNHSHPSLVTRPVSGSIPTLVPPGPSWALQWQPYFFYH